MIERDRIINRVRKLLAFEEGKATDGEIRNAMAKAQELIESYAITQAEIAAAGDRDERVSKAVDVAARITSWHAVLVLAVVEAVPGVSSVRGMRYDLVDAERGMDALDFQMKSYCVFIGPPDLVEIATVLFCDVFAIIESNAKRQFGSAVRGPGRSYAEGFAVSILRRVRSQVKESANAEQIKGIVLASKQANLEWYEKKHDVKIGNPKKSARRGQSNVDAYFKGRCDGLRADFQPGRRRPKLTGTAGALP